MNHHKLTSGAGKITCTICGQEYVQGDRRMFADPCMPQPSLGKRLISGLEDLKQTLERGERLGLNYKVTSIRMERDE